MWERANELSEESLAIARELGDKWVMVRSLGSLGARAGLRGDYARAGLLYEGSLALNQALGDKRGIALSLDWLGGLAWRQGELGNASRLLKESAALFRCSRGEVDSGCITEPVGAGGPSSGRPRAGGSDAGGEPGSLPGV